VLPLPFDDRRLNAPNDVLPEMPCDDFWHFVDVCLESLVVVYCDRARNKPSSSSPAIVQLETQSTLSKPGGFPQRVKLESQSRWRRCPVLRQELTLRRSSSEPMADMAFKDVDLVQHLRASTGQLRCRRRSRRII
jgi:hypothetical protein